MKMIETTVEDLTPLLENVDLYTSSVGYAPEVFEYLGFSIHKMGIGIALVYADHIVIVGKEEITTIREGK